MPSSCTGGSLSAFVMSRAFLPSVASSGEFGITIPELPIRKPPLASVGPVTLQLRNHGVYVFELTVLRHGGRWSLTCVKSDSMIVGYRDSAFVDKETERVLRVYTKAEGIPPDLPVQIEQFRLDYDFAQIGEQGCLLPLKVRVRVCRVCFLSRIDRVIYTARLSALSPSLQCASTGIDLSCSLC